MALNFNERLVIAIFNPYLSGETYYYSGIDEDGDWTCSTSLDDAEHFFTMNGAQNASEKARKTIDSRTEIEYEKITVKQRIHHYF